MLKKVPDLVHHYLNSQDRIKYISTAYYYRLFDMVNELVKQSGTNKEDITIITCNFENYRKLKKHNYNTIYYYDLIHFNDDTVFLKKPFDCETPLLLFDIVNTMEHQIIEEICNRNLRSIIFIFYDKFIPGIMNTIDSNNYFYNHFNDRMVEKPQNDSTLFNSNIAQLLNKIRAKEKLNKIFLTDNENVRIRNVEQVSPVDIDITKPVITPLVSIVQKLNISIRDHYLVSDRNDKLRPMLDDYMTLYQLSECIDDSGNIYVLPRGYRFKLTDVQDTFGHNNYKIYFDYETSDFEVKNVSMVISKSFIENMYYGYEYSDNDKAFKAFFGYVLLDVLSYDNNFQSGTVVYDETRVFDLHTLYTSCLPIKKNLLIYYNLSRPISV